MDLLPRNWGQAKAHTHGKKEKGIATGVGKEGQCGICTKELLAVRMQL